MREQDWPDTARKAIEDAVTRIGLAAATQGTVADLSDYSTAVLAALAPHVTPTAPLRDLANEWDSFPNEPTPPYRPLDAHRCAKELREVIDRG